VILVHPLSRPLSIWEAFAGEKRKGVGNDAIKITRLRLVLDTLQCESFARPFYLVNFFQPISINSVSADRVLQPTFGAWGCRSLSGLACALSVWGPIAIQIMLPRRNSQTRLLPASRLRFLCGASNDTLHTHATSPIATCIVLPAGLNAECVSGSSDPTDFRGAFCAEAFPVPARCFGLLFYAAPIIL
jgi:hypothetical protein